MAILDSCSSANDQRLFKPDTKELLLIVSLCSRRSRRHKSMDKDACHSARRPQTLIAEVNSFKDLPSKAFCHCKPGRVLKISPLPSL